MTGPGGRRLARLAASSHSQARPRFRAQFEQSLRRLVPGMHCKTERSPVHREEGAAAEERKRLKRVLRSEVHVTPGRMERAHLQHHEVERPKPFADRLILRCEGRLAAGE